MGFRRVLPLVATGVVEIRWGAGRWRSVWGAYLLGTVVVSCFYEVISGENMACWGLAGGDGLCVGDGTETCDDGSG